MKIFLVILAVLCAATAWIGIQGLRQRSVVRRIRGLGGYVIYAGQCDSQGREISGAQPRGPAWLRRYIGDDFFDEPVGMRIYRNDWDGDNEVVVGLGRLRRLELVIVDGYRLSQEDLRGLSDLKALRSLCLTESPLDDSDTKFLRGLPLEWLSLHRTRVSDKGLRDLADLRSLKYLDLTRTRVGDKGLRSLEGLNTLRTLIVRRCKVTRSGADQLRGKLPDCQIEWEPL